MSVTSDPLVVDEASAKEREQLAVSAWELVRLRALKQSVQPDMLQGLGTVRDAASLVSVGLVQTAKRQPHPDQYLLEALPVLWWVHYHIGVDALVPLADEIDPSRAHDLAHAATRLIAELDKGDHPPAWHTGPDRVPMLALESGDVPEKSLVLARGLALTMRVTGGTIAPILQYMQHHASTDLCRAVSVEPMLAENVSWLSALMFRGDARTRALAATSLAMSGEHTHIALQSVVALIPTADLVHVADVHGLLGLLPNTHSVRNMLRTAVLTRIWQGDPVSTVPWWEAFRGEDLIARILPECGEHTVTLCRSLLDALPAQAMQGDNLADGPRSDAITLLLTRTLQDVPTFDGALRRAEAVLRDRFRFGEDPSVGRALRGYASILHRTAQNLLQRGERGTAQALFARLIRLGRAYPLALPRGLFPERLEMRLKDDMEASARRWALRHSQESTPNEVTSPPRLQADDPLPDAREIVAALGSTTPLPRLTGRWAGALGWSAAAVLGLMLPLPFRYLLLRLAQMLGCTPRANFLLSDEGRGAVCKEYRVFGITVHRIQRSIAGGRLFLFPVENVAADRLLGRWVATLLLVGTVGTWLALRSTTTLSAAIATTMVAGVILAYLGAVALHRRVVHGMAVAVIDSEKQLSVWAIDPETRYLLERHADRSQRPGIADIATARPQDDDYTPLALSSEAPATN